MTFFLVYWFIGIIFIGSAEYFSDTTINERIDEGLLELGEFAPKQPRSILVAAYLLSMLLSTFIWPLFIILALIEDN